MGKFTWAWDGTRWEWGINGDRMEIGDNVMYHVTVTVWFNCNVCNCIDSHINHCTQQLRQDESINMWLAHHDIKAVKDMAYYSRDMSSFRTHLHSTVRFTLNNIDNQQTTTACQPPPPSTIHSPSRPFEATVDLVPEGRTTETMVDLVSQGRPLEAMVDLCPSGSTP